MHPPSRSVTPVASNNESLEKSGQPGGKIISSALSDDEPNIVNVLQRQTAQLKTENRRLAILLEQEQHKCERLADELETIPEYVHLYQTERQSFAEQVMSLKRELASVRLERDGLLEKLHQLTGEMQQNGLWIRCSCCQGPVRDL